MSPWTTIASRVRRCRSRFALWRLNRRNRKAREARVRRGEPEFPQIDIVCHELVPEIIVSESWLEDGALLDDIDAAFREMLREAYADSSVRYVARPRPRPRPRQAAPIPPPRFPWE